MATAAGASPRPTFTFSVAFSAHIKQAIGDRPYGVVGDCHKRKTTRGKTFSLGSLLVDILLCNSIYLPNGKFDMI